MFQISAFCLLEPKCCGLSPEFFVPDSDLQWLKNIPEEKTIKELNWSRRMDFESTFEALYLFVLRWTQMDACQPELKGYEREIFWRQNFRRWVINWSVFKNNLWLLFNSLGLLSTPKQTLDQARSSVSGFCMGHHQSLPSRISIGLIKSLEFSQKFYDSIAWVRIIKSELFRQLGFLSIFTENFQIISLRIC